MTENDGETDLWLWLTTCLADGANRQMTSSIDGICSSSMIKFRLSSNKSIVTFVVSEFGHQTVILICSLL